MTPTNSHAQQFPGTPGETLVVTGGMAVDNFTAQDADAVKTLLAKHGLGEQFSVMLGVQDTDDFYGIVPVGAGISEDDEVLIVLNGDDETHARFDDSVVPGAFVFELCQFLARVSVRGFAGSTVEYVNEAFRKGIAITYETSPAWSDYEWLLKR